MDFTIKIQEELIRTLVNISYDFKPVKQLLQVEKLAIFA